MRVALSASLILGIIALPSLSGAEPTPSQIAATNDANAPIGGGSVELRKIVVALNGGSDVSSSADMFAALQMRVIGTNDPSWKRDNPNWAPVFNLVKADLKRDIVPAYAAQEKAIAAQWDQALAAHLSAAETNELLGFFRSPVGRHFLAMQRALTAIQSEGTSALMVSMASGGMPPDSVPADRPSTAVIDERKRLLGLSWTSLILLSVGAAAGQAQGMTASDNKAAAEMIKDMLATTRGPALDALNRQYQGELAAFVDFEQSQDAKALISVYAIVAADAAGQPASPGNNFVEALQHSVDVHTPAWKAAYESGRSRHPSGSPATTEVR